LKKEGSGKETFKEGSNGILDGEIV